MEEERPRRPQWRGERRAVLVRLPVEVAEDLAATAQGADRSLSETAGELIERGLRERRQGAA